jgi:hypothetical protein
MQVTKGRILAQRIFDVADEVRLAEAEALLRRTSDQLSFVRTASRIRNTQPPLQVVLDAGFAGVEGLAARSVVTRIYDLGAVVVTFDIPLPGPMSGEELIAFAARVLDAEERITDEARPIAEGVARAVASASRIGEVSTIVEDYTVIVIEGTEPKVTGDEFMRELDVARLLLGEKSTIANTERGHVMRQTFSYNPDELVVLDWNSALIVDRGGGLEVADVIELATMQLLELRAYDQIVQRQLTRLYKEIGGRKRRGFLSRHYRQLSIEIMRLFVDLSELTDRFDNSLQMIGDTWLARIHRAAVEEFDIPRWRRMLEEKLNVLHQFNTLLVDQVTTRDSMRLEAAIVALIVFEIALALVKFI